MIENRDRSLFEGWMNGRRSLSIFASLGSVRVAAFCTVAGVTDDTVTLSLGTSKLDLIDFSFDGWNLSLTPASPDAVDFMGSKIESSLSGARDGMSLSIFLLANS
jgi:hypothetical protein